MFEEEEVKKTLNTYMLYVVCVFSLLYKETDK